MVRTGKITVSVAWGTYQQLRAHGRGLAWGMAESGLSEIDREHLTKQCGERYRKRDRPRL